MRIRELLREWKEKVKKRWYWWIIGVPVSLLQDRFQSRTNQWIDENFQASKAVDSLKFLIAHFDAIALGIFFLALLALLLSAYWGSKRGDQLGSLPLPTPEDARPYYGHQGSVQITHAEYGTETSSRTVTQEILRMLSDPQLSTTEGLIVVPVDSGRLGGGAMPVSSKNRLVIHLVEVVPEGKALVVSASSSATSSAKRESAPPLLDAHSLSSAFKNDSKPVVITTPKPLNVEVHIYKEGDQWVWRLCNRELAAIGPISAQLVCASSYDSERRQYREDNGLKCSFGNSPKIPPGDFGPNNYFARIDGAVLEIGDTRGSKLSWPTGDSSQIHRWQLGFRIQGIAPKTPGPTWILTIWMEWNPKTRSISIDQFSSGLLTT